MNENELDEFNRGLAVHNEKVRRMLQYGGKIAFFWGMITGALIFLAAIGYDARDGCVDGFTAPFCKVQIDGE